MASNIEVKDASAVNKTMKTTEMGSTHTPHHHVDSAPATAAEGAALPGVFMVVAGDDGTDTHPLQVDSSGFLRVTSTASAVAGESAALPSEFMVVAGDDGTNTHPLQVDDSTGGLKVILQTGSVIPTGGATAANQATIIGHVDGVETLSTAANALLLTIDEDTNDIKGSTAALENCVTGSELQVDVVTVTLPTTIYHGKETVDAAGTDQTIRAAGSQAITSGVTVKALAGNTGIIYVGAENVAAATGFELSAKESVFIEVADIASVWIDAATTDDGVTYIAT